MSLQGKVIFQLVDSRATGGIESHIFNLSLWLKRNGYRTEVLFLKDYGEHPFKDQLTAAGVSWCNLKGVSGLARKIRQNSCLLATHGYKAGIIGRVIAKILAVPVVSTYHSGDTGSGKLRWYSKLDDLSAGLADQVICVSSEISSRLPVASVQLPNFVDIPPRQPCNGNQIAFVGRLSYEKGPDNFASITEPLAAKAPVCLYGDGPMHKQITSQYPHLISYGRVDMEKHWQEIGLLCITSRFEGLPLVALEAMTRGIPVVSYALGGLPELIQHNRNGWLIKPGNQNDFRAAIQQWLVLTATMKAAIASSACQRIRTVFSSDAVVPQLLQAYRQALHLRGNTPHVNKGSL